MESGPTGYWWYKQVTVPVRQRCSKRMRVPQGVCENLINALKLLANQPKDGDCPILSITTGFCERSRKGNMEGLRNFIEVDNHSALDVGHLKEGTRSVFSGTKAKARRGVSRGVNQGRSRGLDAQNRRCGFKKKCINVDHIAEERWAMIGMPLPGDLQRY